jgi:hypothetical protein
MRVIMSKNSKAVLLFEFKFHQEILPTQIKFLLNAGYDVHLFLDRDLWDGALFSCVHDKIRVTLVSDTTRWLNKLKLYFALKKYVREHNISHLVVNTLDSTFGSLLINALSDLNKVGIAHRVHEISSNKTFENNVRQMDAVLTLSVKTHEYISANFPWVAQPGWFYPIFFCSDEVEKVKASGNAGISIVIPGQISNERRDYRSLISAAKYLREKKIRVRFKLLGNALRFDGPALKDEIHRAGLDDCFRIWEGFVPYNVFLQEISNADFVMPLLSPDQANSDNYHCSQISAAINWALGFRKKLLLHEHFCDLDFLAPNSILYNNTNMADVLASLTKPADDDFISVPELCFENISKNYLKGFRQK